MAEVNKSSRQLGSHAAIAERYGLFLPPLNNKRKRLECVLAGTACVGKTTLLNELAGRGYPCRRESAMEVIASYFERGIDVRENLLPLQIDLLKHQSMLERELEQILKPGDIAFFDRCYVDQIPYCRNAGLEPPKEVLFAAEYRRFDLVFILDLLPFYEQEGRWQSAEEAARMQPLFMEAYESYGYKPILVPFASVAERVDFVLKKVKLLLDSRS